MLDKTRLVKLVMMTTSNHDGEALNAIRMANSLLAANKLNWSDILLGGEEELSIGDLLKKAKANCNPDSSFMEFLESLEMFWLTRGYLSARQFEVLRKAAQSRK